MVQVLISMLINLTFFLMMLVAVMELKKSVYFYILPAEIFFYVLFLIMEVGKWPIKLLQEITNLKLVGD